MDDDLGRAHLVFPRDAELSGKSTNNRAGSAVALSIISLPGDNGVALRAKQTFLLQVTPSVSGVHGLAEHDLPFDSDCPQKCLVMADDDQCAVETF